MQEYEKTEERLKKMKKTPSSNSSNSINKCIDQVFKKNKYRGKYVKISNDRKNLLRDWLSKHPQPNSNDFISISQSIEEPVENIQKWYRNQKKTNKDIKKGVSKTKRILSKAEEEILEKAFRNNIKPKPEKYKELAKKITINSKQIRKWFKYRRRKLKKFFSDRVPMPSSQMKGKTIDSSESSYKTSNSSPNLSTNDLKSQQNISSSDSNQLHQMKEKMVNNQQENNNQNIKMNEPENSNIQVNNKQTPMNISNNYNNMYQSQNNMNGNYPHMIFTYPLVQTNLETPQQAIPIISNNNIYRIIQNAVSPLVYLQNPSTTPCFVNGTTFQQTPVLMKNIPNYNLNCQTQPHYVLMNNRNAGPVNSDLIKNSNESFENMNNEKAQAYCFLNQNKPVQISNNNQNLFNNIIYLKPHNDIPAFIPNQNMMPNLNLIQNLQILQPQNQPYCLNSNSFPQNFPNNNFMNNGVYQMNSFTNQNVNMKMNNANQNEMMQNFNEDHKMEEN